MSGAAREPNHKHGRRIGFPAPKSANSEAVPVSVRKQLPSLRRKREYLRRLQFVEIERFLRSEIERDPRPFSNDACDRAGSTESTSGRARIRFAAIPQPRLPGPIQDSAIAPRPHYGRRPHAAGIFAAPAPSPQPYGAQTAAERALWHFGSLRPRGCFPGPSLGCRRRKSRPSTARIAIAFV